MMSRKEFESVVVRFRRFLRVEDNRALLAACDNVDEVIPLLFLTTTLYAVPTQAQPKRPSCLTPIQISIRTWQRNLALTMYPETEAFHGLDH
jgi:deoxyribodipyrimidine photolyase